MKEDVKNLLEKMKADIQNNLDISGITTSDRLKNSLNVVDYDDGVKLVSSWKFFATTEVGRKAGKMPPVDPILEWVYRRGIIGDSESKTKGIAFAIAKKIGQEGYGRPTPPHVPFGSTESNIYSQIVNAYIPQIRMTIKNNILQTIKLNIK